MVSKNKKDTISRRIENFSFINIGIGLVFSAIAFYLYNRDVYYNYGESTLRGKIILVVGFLATIGVASYYRGVLVNRRTHDIKIFTSVFGLKFGPTYSFKDFQWIFVTVGVTIVSNQSYGVLKLFLCPPDESHVPKFLVGDFVDRKLVLALAEELGEFMSLPVKVTIK